MQKSKRKVHICALFSLICLPVLAAGCVSVKAISHDENEAAKSAYDFTNIAFVQREETAAYQSLAQDFRDHSSLDDFIQLIAEIHPKGYPSQVVATEYQPNPGTKTMNIFLMGDNPDENFYYRLVMEGTASTGYKVAGIFRGNKRYPDSADKKKL